MPLLVVDAGSGHTLTDAPVSSLIRLPHPRTGVVVQYLKVGATLCELQRVRPPTPASYFVGQEVHTDGALTLATRVDPGFLLLRALAVNGARFSPLDQTLAAADGTGDSAAGKRAGAEAAVQLSVLAGLDGTPAQVPDA